jgi:O-acetyl-ADP-ribose deacetylase (regulator of RNase III)
MLGVMKRDVIATEDLGQGRTFAVVVGDLLSEPVDAIVNAANGGLSHGGGVAALISREAGSALDDEGDAIVKQRGRLPTGEAVVTTAGRLSQFKGVIHAVGPVQGDGDEEAKLAAAIRSALLRAHERGWKAVSFPAVSSGIFAVPPAVCAKGYVRGVKEFFAQHPTSSVTTARLVVLKPGPVSDEVVRLLR